MAHGHKTHEGPGCRAEHDRHGHRHHHRGHGSYTEDRDGRSPGVGDEWRYGRGRRRPARREGPAARRGGEGREAVVSLVTALRQVGLTGDDGQRQSARVVIDGAVRAIWSILAEGPTAPAANTNADEEAGPAADAATEV